jgi:hypothetical protein
MTGYNIPIWKKGKLMQEYLSSILYILGVALFLLVLSFVVEPAKTAHYVGSTYHNVISSFQSGLAGD